MTTFLDFALSEPITRALQELGFTTPTPIQEKAIPHILTSSQDILALAQTGTGKTAAFGLPLLEKIDTANPNPQVIILCPTRELCLQICTDIQKYAKHMRDMRITSVFGGAPITNQIRQLKQGTQIVVGTPGRVIDLINRKVLKLQSVQWAVLDEADEMLNMGFVDDITEILSYTPAEKQTLLFSATMSSSIEKITRKYMKSPLRIEVEATKERDKAISHFYISVHARDRFMALRRIIDSTPDIYAIVFCRTRRETQEIADKLIAGGYNVGVLHGDIPQDQRTHIMKQFKEHHTTILVATDVAARGIDAPKLTHVLHYGLPEKIENYVHRSGRTGRANAQGTSIAIINMHEGRTLRMIERDAELIIAPMTLPTWKNVITTHLMAYVETLKTPVLPNDESNEYVAQIFNALDLPKEEVALRALSQIVQKMLKDHPREEVQQVSRDSGGRDGGRFDRNDRGGRNDRFDRDRGRTQERTSSSPFLSIELNIGERDNIEKRDIIRLINDVSRGRRVDIGKIYIRPSFTSLEIPEDEISAITSALTGHTFKHRRLEAKRGVGGMGPAPSSRPPRRDGRSGGGDRPFFPGKRGR